MKKRIISMILAFSMCFATVGYFKIPKLPTIPSVTNGIKLPEVNIPTKYFEGIKLPIKVVL